VTSIDTAVGRSSAGSRCLFALLAIAVQSLRCARQLETKDPGRRGPAGDFHPFLPPDEKARPP